MRLAVVLTYLVCVSSLQAGDWPQFLGPSRNGVSTETDLAKRWPKGGPKVLWSKDVGPGWSGPVVVAERAILFHRLGDEEVLWCLNATTGETIWTSKYPTNYVDEFGFDEGPRCTPVVAQEKIFTLGPSGELSAFDWKKGERLWHRNVMMDYKAPKNFFGVGSSPIWMDGKLLVNVGAKKAGIVAFDPENGKELWKATDEEVSYSSPVVGKMDNEELAVFFTRSGLLALTPSKGEVRYQYPWRPRINTSVNAASPIVVGHQIFLSTSYNRGAVVLEANKGELKELWSNDTSLSCHYHTPVFYQDHLYGVDGRSDFRNTKLRCVEWKTGKVKWNKDNFGSASVILADGQIYAMSEFGDLVLLQATPQEYKELGRSKILGEKTRAVMALSNGKIYARDEKKWVCIDVK